MHRSLDVTTLIPIVTITACMMLSEGEKKTGKIMFPLDGKNDIGIDGRICLTPLFKN